MDLDYENALKEYNLAEQGIPGNAKLYEYRGYTYRRMGDIEAALATWRKGMAL